MRGANLARTFDTDDKAPALAWARAQEAKLLADAKVQDGQAAFLTVAELMPRCSEEVSPGKRGERREVVRLTMMPRDPSSGTVLRDCGPEQVAVATAQACGRARSSASLRAGCIWKWPMSNCWMGRRRAGRGSGVAPINPEEFTSGWIYSGVRVSSALLRRRGITAHVSP